MSGILDLLDDKTCSVCNGRNGIEGLVRKADGEVIHVNRPCPVCNPTGALPMLAKSRAGSAAREAEDDDAADKLSSEHEKYKGVLGEHGYATHPIESEHFAEGVVHAHNHSGGHQVVVSLSHNGISEWEHHHNHRVRGAGVGHASLDEHLESIHDTHGNSTEHESAAEHRAADELSMRKDEGKLRRSGMIAGILDFIEKARGGKKKDKAKRHGKIKSAAGKAKVKKTMHEWGKGKLHSGSKHGPKVTNQKQAVAIALNQARKVGKSFGILDLVRLAKAGMSHDDALTDVAREKGSDSSSWRARHSKWHDDNPPKWEKDAATGKPRMTQGDVRGCPFCRQVESRKSAGALGIMDFINKSEEAPECPACGGPGSHLGTLGTREHFRCRNCGADFSHKESEEYKTRPSDEKRSDRKFRSGMDKAIWQNILTKKSASRHGDSRDCPKCGGAGLYVMEIGERTLMHCQQCGDDYSYLHHRWNDPTEFIEAKMAEEHLHTEPHHISNIEAGDNAEKSAGKPLTFTEDLGGEHGILDEIIKAKKKAKLGSGARFKKVEKNAKGARNPAAVAAAAGMKKYGKRKMEKMAAAGKKRAAK